MSHLQGKVALVTGGGSGIGRAIAMEFARCGADVAVAARRKEPLEETARAVRDLGRRALVCTLDIRDAEQNRGVAKQVSEEFGHLDLLVNNAGIARQGPLVDTSDDDVDALVDIDLKGPIHTIRAALPALIRSAEAERGPAICNISSNVTQMALGNYAVYSAAKAGIDMLTRCLALELATHRIRVNAILPGVVDTPIFDTMMPTDDARQFLDSFGEAVPLGRVGQPADIARLARTLCSDESGWITGALVPVDGGLSLGPT